ncbi:hypothetical protein [Micromonospora sp. 4G55]|uniref:hypothetical protein n=1 Tax=Micromonospora sp. 4G55 TaxID=2806102 RepID=UPI001A38AD72|nr:hypothetical protein [Micromonospora sp. 4G55]MBM0257366.1 hypothetical protein [Micromonospora sp. 4G55]
MTTYVVEVNEGKVEASRQGIDWWMLFRIRMDGTGRLHETTPPCVIGGVVEVACDSRDDADWLATHMVHHGGLPRTTVRVKESSAGDP